ncbi:MAG TPA: TolC family protein [Gemmatimonadales bacterium]|nr:TolC family protein [Gemmatimonadales bacterium]
MRHRLVAMAIAASLAMPGRALAQQPDSLALATFLDEVSRHHPVARQAQLLEAQAEAVARGALGAVIDPTLSVRWDRKQFEGSEYFNYLDAALKVPTPLGVDVKLGYERTRGRYIGEDRRTPTDGLLSLGISIPVGQGIITDRRRAALAEARGLTRMAAGERRAIVNKLLLEATKAWADWRAAEARLALATEGVEVAQFRLEGIRARVRAGDAAPIDTVEAALEVARREAAQAFAEADRIGARESLAAMRWAADGAPVDLQETTVPGAVLDDEVPAAAQVSAWLAEALRDHPDIAKALGKEDASVAVRRQALADLFPDFEVEAARLADYGETRGLTGFPPAGGAYKFGVAASTSLLLFKERGKADEAGAKRVSAAFAVADARRAVAAAARTAAAELVAASIAADRQALAVQYARRLRDAEEARFAAGESSLFLVNQRERTLLDEGVKLADAEAKGVAARAALAVALGYPARLPEP